MRLKRKRPGGRWVINRRPARVGAEKGRHVVNGQARPEFQASAPNSRRWSVHGDSRANQAREQAHGGEDDSVSAMEASRREGGAVPNTPDRAHDSGAGPQVW